MKSFIRNIRMSPRKVSLVAGLIRGLSVKDALLHLKFMNKGAASVLYKAVASAVSNAEHNEKKKSQDLIISEIIINKGRVLKRGMPVSRGRWHKILKFSSHISIKLQDITDKQ